MINSTPTAMTAKIYTGTSVQKELVSLPEVLIDGDDDKLPSGADGVADLLAVTLDVYEPL
jgi:hypothetical protein